MLNASDRPTEALGQYGEGGPEQCGNSAGRAPIRLAAAQLYARRPGGRRPVRGRAAGRGTPWPSGPIDLTMIAPVRTAPLLPFLFFPIIGCWAGLACVKRCGVLLSPSRT